MLRHVLEVVWYDSMAAKELGMDPWPNNRPLVGPPRWICNKRPSNFWVATLMTLQRIDLFVRSILLEKNSSLIDFWCAFFANKNSDDGRNT